MQCGICNKSKEEVLALVKVGTEYICSQCISEVNTKINKTRSKKKKVSHDVVPSTKELVTYLDQFIIGQDDAKKTLAIAIRNHFKRINSLQDDSDVVLQKQNVMIVGKSGTGKTEMVKLLSNHIHLPMVVVDSNNYTSAGYTGGEIDSIIKDLYEKSGRNKELTEKGIVFLDEIDKKKKGALDGGQKDVGGEEVQKSLLKLVEGTEVKVGGVTIDTTNILFISGGAFVGLDKIVNTRVSNNSIGFLNKAQTLSENMKKVNNEDFFKFGMIPEFMGRFPIVTFTEELTHEQMVSIIKEPKNSIYKQYQKLFKLDNIELDIHDEVLYEIVTRVNKEQVGVRGIPKHFDDILKEHQFNLETYSTGNVTKISAYMGDDKTIKFRKHKKRGNTIAKNN